MPQTSFFPRTCDLVSWKMMQRHVFSPRSITFPDNFCNCNIGIVGSSCHKYFCCDKTFVATKSYVCQDKCMLVVTNLCLSQEIFVMTKLLSGQKCFIATNIILLQQNFCHDKHTFVATKMILVAAPASETLVAFVLLGNSRLNFHCYTQCEPMPTHKLAWHWQLQPFVTSCVKDYKGHSLVQTSFTEPPNR